MPTPPPSQALIELGFSPRVVPPDGTGSSGICVIGEGPGKHEDTDLIPFHPQADAGSVLARVLRRAGVDRGGLTISNACWCFLSARTHIFTSEGYKEIHQLKPGDLVLTHLGRFRPITGVYQQIGGVDAIRLTIQHTKYGNYLSTSHICVTANHRILAADGRWKEASEFSLGDTLTVLGEHCIQCNKLFNRSFKKRKFLPFCSLACHQIFAARKGIPKLSAYMKEEFKSGRRSGQSLNLSGIAAQNRLRKTGWEPQWSESSRHSQRIKCALARQALGLNGGRWIGFGERALSTLLSITGYEHTPQFALEGYNYDFKVGQTLLEVDGPGSRNIPRRKQDAVKLEVATRHKYDVVHVPHDNLEVALNVLKNHDGDYEFCSASIVKTEKFFWRKGTWTIAVEDDESYVGQGVVSHNSRPPLNELADQPYESLAVEYWRPFNEALIAQRQPKVVLLLGNTALKAYSKYGIDDDGTSITHLQNYAFPLEIGGHRTIGLAGLHPSFILHGQQAFTGVLIWLFQRALQFAKTGLIPKPTRYLTSLSLDDARSFELNFHPDQQFLAYDIETPESGSLDDEEMEDQEHDISYDIKRISLCYDASTGYAASWPHMEPFISIAKRMLARAQRREVWNEGFDNPRLRAARYTLGGRGYDRMRSWRFLQPTLPASLEFATPLLGWTNGPWKFLNQSDPEHYSATDAFALKLNGEAIEKSLRARGMYERHERHVVDTFEILGKMAVNGLPYDKEAAAAFKLKLEGLMKEREDYLQTVIPESLKPVKQKKGYKKLPADTSGLVKRKFKLKVSEMSKVEVALYVKPETAIDIWGKEYQSTPEVFEVERWAKLEEFLPTSSHQKKALLKHFGHRPGTNRKTKKETVDDDTMQKTILKCIKSSKPRDKELMEILKACRECMQLSKVLGTYVGGWKTGKDGRVHGTPGVWGKMFRISWRNPNISATIQDKTEDYIASGFRRCVSTIASGRIMTESDYRGMEAVLVGYFAKDPDYMRFGRIGVHAVMLALTLADTGKIPQSDVPDLTWSEDDIKAAIKPLKKKFAFEYDQNKHGVHLSNYLGTPFLMNTLYPESFPKLEDAERWQEFYFTSVARKVKKWHDETLEKVHKEGFLRGPFYSMTFWEIYRWNSQRCERLLKLWQKQFGYQASGQRWVLNANEQAWITQIKKFMDAGLLLNDAVAKLSWDLGDDAKSAISFLPRDTGAGMLKEVLYRLEHTHHLASDGIMLASTHDSILTECAPSDLERVARIVKSEMEAPVPELEGLSIGVDQKCGKTWHEADMESYQAPIPVVENLALASSVGNV